MIASAIAIALWKLLWLVYHEFTSPLRHLPGPKATSLIYGNMGDIWETESCFLQEKWVKEYGNTLRYKGFFCTNRLLTIDASAINHFLAHSSDYQRPFYIRHSLAKIFGNGEVVRHLVCKQWDLMTLRIQHLVLLKFEPSQVSSSQKAVRLRDVFSSEIAKNPTGSTTSACIDVLPWLHRVTLDVIGLAGFNYNIDALNANETPSELNEAFSAVTAIPKFVSHRTMQRIGRELLTSAKAVARAGAKETGEIDKSSIHGRDLFTQLVKANMATDIPRVRGCPMRMCWAHSDCLGTTRDGACT
ncbi:hypothetical protein BU15DRAFT_69515 [Melanogaster broomeanus]|nr:hypothetical protein BU15DRAFT_69515 [Melanogaster broomeanus]